MSRFIHAHVFREHRFSLGADTRTGASCISLPVSGFNRAVEFEAYFAISDAEYQRFLANPASASELVARLLAAPDNPRRIR